MTAVEGFVVPSDEGSTEEIEVRIGVVIIDDGFVVTLLT